MMIEPAEVPRQTVHTHTQIQLPSTQCPVKLGSKASEKLQLGYLKCIQEPGAVVQGPHLRGAAWYQESTGAATGHIQPF